MDIGIMTFQRSVSYGAFLQAYALSRYLIDQGHKVQVIDYNPVHRDGKARPWRHRWGGLHPQNLVNIYIHRCFSRYIKRYLPLTERSYRTLQELRDDPPAADAYVCGSDQIWNPTHTGGHFDFAYFCNFGDSHVKRIAYAPSMGTGSVAPELHGELRHALSRMDCLSVRERPGCDLVESVTGRPCAHVLDPTLLHTRYDELYHTNGTAQQPYILVFSLTHSPLLHRVVALVKSKLGLPAVFVASHLRVWRYNWRFRYCSPGDWLSLFRHASAVITDSFHGTAFALRFQKPFISVGLPEKHRGKNVRMTDLLHSIGLEDRFVADTAALENAKEIEVGLNWSRIEELLAARARQSEEFLVKALAA